MEDNQFSEWIINELFESEEDLGKLLDYNTTSDLYGKEFDKKRYLEVKLAALNEKLKSIQA